MSLTEILTAISLFCPHDHVDKYFTGGYGGVDHGNQESLAEQCVAKAWKCIDKVRAPAKFPEGFADRHERLCRGNFRMIDGTAHCFDKKTFIALPFDDEKIAADPVEKCFR